MLLVPFLLSALAFQLPFAPANAFVSPKSLARNVDHNIVSTTPAVARGVSSLQAQKVDLCVIGGGIAGLTAAITTAEKSTQQSSNDDDARPSILLLESDSAVGGRVRSDTTDDGFILDRGFAVFLEEYPQSKLLLDYDALGLQQFWPGAKVKLAGREKLASVSDPLRRPRDIFRAIASPVGSPLDKLRLVPLFYTVMTRSIEELFDMEETDTLTCLREKYHFSDEFVSSFFAPFLEGIYLTSLDMQSSRMFHFVMKMVSTGSTALPKEGMQGVANQLEGKAKGLGVGVQLKSRALSIQPLDGGGFSVDIESKEHGRETVQAESVVVATEHTVARNLLQRVESLAEGMSSATEVSQRSVGCIYYAFESPAPLTDPILILNGEGGQQRRNTKDFPINNVCFPSVVQRTYAPDGYELCSVSVLENALSEYAGDHASLDAAVRRQLSRGFQTMPMT